MSKFKTFEERVEFEKTTGKDARINRYRHLSHLEEGVEITEDNFNTDVFNRICVESGCNPHMFKAQLLNKDNEYWGN